MTFQLLLGLLVSGIANPASGSQPLTITHEGRTAYSICIPRSATLLEETAANELQEHLENVTGARLRILTEDQLGPTAKRIVVGRCECLTELAPDLKIEQLGHDAVVIKTIGSSLILAGPPPRGTLYAVYTFLEDTVGCRWWTSSESFLPSKPTLSIGPLDQVYAPPIQSREAFYRDAFDPPFAARLRLNGHHHRIPPEYGGHDRFNGFVHTFFPLLPPAKYFAEHPDWYSEIDGKRVSERAQLCLTNHSARDELVANALQRLRSDPAARLLSVSQNDWHGRCQCENCLAVERQEGSPSGPLLRFVNAVAAKIETEFPDVLVETLAYQYTRRPPKLVRPRHNVVIRLCSIECSFAQPLGTSEQNATFREDIEAWSAVAPQLFVWDYVTNFSSYILPHPNLRVLAPNIRFFVDNHVIGLFEQGDSTCAVGDFVRLRAWLLAHLMWNPQLDDSTLIAEFLDGYYGPAAPHLQSYLDLLHDAAERSDVYLRCFMNDTSAWLTLDDLNQAMTLFDHALGAVSDDAVLTARVRRERLPLDHVWLKRYDALRRQALLTGKPFRGPADPVAGCEEFIRLCKEHNATSHRERGKFQEYASELRRRFRDPGPPPEPCRGLNRSDWIEFPDNQISAGRPGEWTERVDDERAADGRAIRMPGDHHEWAVQCRLSDDLQYGNPWRCYVAARAEASVADGAAMTMGVYDVPGKRSLSSRTVSVQESAGDGYRVFDLGSHNLNSGVYIWVAPPKRAGEVDSVFVDRIFLIREK